MAFANYYQPTTSLLPHKKFSTILNSQPLSSLNFLADLHQQFPIGLVSSVHDDTMNVGIIRIVVKRPIEDPVEDPLEGLKVPPSLPTLQNLQVQHVMVSPVQAPKLPTSEDLPEGAREMRDEVRHQIVVLRARAYAGLRRLLAIYVRAQREGGRPVYFPGRGHWKRL